MHLRLIECDSLKSNKCTLQSNVLHFYETHLTKLTQNTNNDTFKSKFALTFINPNTKENFWELLFEVESLKI